MKQSWLGLLMIIMACGTDAEVGEQVTEELPAPESERILISTEDPNAFYINDDSEELFYLQFDPPKETKGVVFAIPASGERVESVVHQYPLLESSLEKGYIVIIPSYNMGSLRKETDVQFLAELIEDVVERNDLNESPVIVSGFSNGGLLSLYYAVESSRPGSTLRKPDAVIGVDPPLDLIQLYEYALREIDKDFSQAGVQEAQWIKQNLEGLFGGSPDEKRDEYMHYSVYTLSDVQGGNASLLEDIPVILFSDLNTEFLIHERHRDLNDWNGNAIVALVNKLNLLGNEHAEVVISHNRGKRPNGMVHPHSWNILDEKIFWEWYDGLSE